MNYCHSFRKLWRRLLAAVSLIVFMSAAAAFPALAAETYVPVSVWSDLTYIFREDTTIYLSNNYVAAGITIERGSSNATVTFENDSAVTLTIDTPTGQNTSPRRGIYVHDANNAVIRLGKTAVKSTGTAVEIDGGPNGFTATASFGAGSTFESMNSAAIVGREKVVIDIGERSVILSEGTDEFSHAVSAFDGAVINIGDGATIGQLSDTAYGILAEGRDSAINLGGFSFMKSEGGGGVYAGGGAVVRIGEDSSMTLSGGPGIYGVCAFGSDTLVEIGSDLSLVAEETIGIYVDSGGHVDIGANAYIQTSEGEGSYGLYANGAGSRINLGAGAIIQTGDADALVVMDGARVKLDGASVFTSNGVYAMYVEGKSIAEDILAHIDGAGVFNIRGDIAAGPDGVIDLTMEDGSSFMGKAQCIGEEYESRINLTLDGEDTSWYVTDRSDMTNLYMDGATVDMTHSDLGSAIYTVNLGRSDADNGIFRMTTDIASEFADQLHINGTAQGAYRLQVINDGSQAAAGTEFIALIYVNPGQSATFTLDHTVEMGGFQYELRRPYVDAPESEESIDPKDLPDENAWYLRRSSNGSGASTSGSGAINSFAGSYLMAYADTQSLAQRMGSLRQSAYGQGLWFKIHGGKFESNSKSYVRGFDMDYGGVQIGYDRKIESKRNADVYVGIMFGYGKGDLDYRREGSGEVDTRTLGVYGTYMARNGWYVDAILKYQWMTNDFDVIDTAGALVRGQEAETGGVGASLEIGRRIHVGKGKENKQGWYVEPQAQLSYQRQDGGCFTATNGLRVGVDSFTSLLGRVGLQIGYETEKTNFYAKVSKVKEFDGDLTIRANGVPISESFGDNWWVYGIGCASRINDRNSLYIDIERTSGGSFSQPWRVSAGWRVEF